MKYGINNVADVTVLNDESNSYIDYNSLIEQLDITPENVKRNLRDWLRTQSVDYLKIGQRSFYEVETILKIVNDNRHKFEFDEKLFYVIIELVQNETVFEQTEKDVKRIVKTKTVNQAQIVKSEESESAAVFEPLPIVSTENELRESAPVKKQSRLREFLMSADSYLFATVGVIVALLPFSISAFLKYATFGESGLKYVLSVTMAIVLCTMWDFAILLFTLKGNKTVANIGTMFQIIFISVHFEFLTAVVGERWERLIVIFSIIVYSAYLINRLAVVAGDINENE